MTEITFYLSKQTGQYVLQDLARRIAGKAHQQGRQVYIHCRDEAHCQDTDALLWQRPHTGFLPHSLATEGSAPVVLGFGNDPGDYHDVLINLAEQVPDFASRFHRVAELISGNPDERQQGRERYRYYQHRGFPVTTHDLG